MGHSGWFTLSSASQEWRGFWTLALVCTRARVTNLQARVLLLWVRGLTYGEITNTLSLKDRSIPRKTLLGATRRIAEVLPSPSGKQGNDWAADVLQCFRNQHAGPTARDADTFTRRGGGDHLTLVRDYYTCSWSPRPGSPRLVTPDDLQGERIPDYRELRTASVPLTLEEELLLWLDDLRQSGPAPTWDDEGRPLLQSVMVRLVTGLTEGQAAELKSLGIRVPRVGRQVYGGKVTPEAYRAIEALPYVCHIRPAGMVYPAGEGKIQTLV